MAYFDRKDDYEYVRWADHIRRRDHYTCTVCGRRGVTVNAHHLNAWASFPAQRFDVDNGVCLCQDCHDKFHEIFGKGKNTKKQFEEYKAMMESIIKIANDEAAIQCATRRMLQIAEKDIVTKKIIEDLNGDKNYEKTISKSEE